MTDITIEIEQKEITLEFPNEASTITIGGGGGGASLNMGKRAFSTTITEPPASQTIRLNHATPASATEVYVDDEDNDAVNWGGKLVDVTIGSWLKIGVDEDNQWHFKVTAISDETDYVKYGIDNTKTVVKGTVSNAAEVLLVIDMATVDAVGSVFGRTGAVAAVSGDYDADEIDETNKEFLNKTDDTQVIAKNKRFSGQARSTPAANKAYGATPIFDMNDGNYQKMILTGNVTSLAILNEQNGSAYVIILELDGSARTIATPDATWGTKTDNSADFLETANAINTVNIMVDPDGKTRFTIETET